MVNVVSDEQIAQSKGMFKETSKDKYFLLDIVGDDFSATKYSRNKLGFLSSEKECIQHIKPSDLKLVAVQTMVITNQNISHFLNKEPLVEVENKISNAVTYVGKSRAPFGYEFKITYYKIPEQYLQQ